MENEIIKFGELIKKSNKIILINHIRMDPDAFGSLATVYNILKKMNKEVIAINDMNQPESFDFLGAKEIIKTDFNIADFNPELIISFDAASIGQLGDTYKNNENIFNKTDFVVIDHHMTNPKFGSINIVNPDFSSTCELTYFILEKLELDKFITPKEATLLTAGIHTDTNIFYNSNTSSDTLRVAAKLMDLGADFRSPMYNFFLKSSFEKTKLYGRIFEKLKKSDDGKIIWAKITKKDFEETGSSDEDTSGVTNRLINIDGCEIAFLIHELGETTKASFRSKSFSVGDLCASFPTGGGHKLAAGFRSEKNIDLVEKEILEKLKKETL